MAEQVFTAAEREAIWRAHAGKCAYTREILDISSFHIDHVLPEALRNDPPQMHATLKKLGLPGDFNILGWENLLPSRPSANLQKGANVFDSAHVHFFLGIAAGKKPDVLRYLEIIDRRKNRGRAIFLLQQCLERGELSAREVADILEKYSEAPEAIFELVQGMHFADAEEVKVVTLADIEALRDRAMHFGENSGMDSLVLTSDEKGERIVRTCREYEQALSEGFYAYTTVDIKVASRFEHQCGLLNALESARPPSSSFVSHPKVGVLDLAIMPISFFPYFGDTGPGHSANVTYQNKVDEGALVIKRVSHNLLQIEEPHGMGQQLVEVVRADFNGDGIEDILLFEYCYATEGTLGYGLVRIITRTSSTGMFETVSCTRSSDEDGGGDA
jgi:hypothetical protein